MNKQELISKMLHAADKYNIDKYEVGAGGHLVMLGLRDTTDDIDVSVDEKTFWRLVNENLLPVKEIEDGILLAPLTEDIDIHVKDGVLAENIIEEVQCCTEEDTLLLKQTLNRCKDQKDIAKLKAYMGISG